MKFLSALYQLENKISHHPDRYPDDLFGRVGNLILKLEARKKKNDSLRWKRRWAAQG